MKIIETLSMLLKRLGWMEKPIKVWSSMAKMKFNRRSIRKIGFIVFRISFITHDYSHPAIVFLTKHLMINYFTMPLKIITMEINLGYSIGVFNENILECWESFEDGWAIEVVLHGEGNLRTMWEEHELIWIYLQKTVNIRIEMKLLTTRISTDFPCVFFQFLKGSFSFQ
jgi:hypothetical protein